MAKFELKQLSTEDGQDVFDMLQTMPAKENGFENAASGMSFEEFKAWLAVQDGFSKGVGLADWMVAQNIYWLYADGKPVGVGKLRHALTKALRHNGGHCGYGIAPSYRGRGYATALLALITEEAAKLGIDEMLLTVDEGNVPSVKVAQKCGGTVQKTAEGRHYITIATAQ